MGADSALTHRGEYITDRFGMRRPRISTGDKVFQIPKIHAGISYWGEATIGGQTTDQWISAFVQSAQYSTIDDFAVLLQNELRNLVPALTDPEGSRRYRYGRRVFHLAGFVEHKGELVPTFYHIHNGQSETNLGIDPRIINANHDFPPERVMDHFLKDEIPHICNWDFFQYRDLFSSIFSVFNNWRERLSIDGQPFIFPDPQKFPDTLTAYAEFVRFWIRLVRDIYALSNYPEIIGGDVRVLSIKPNGFAEISSKP